MTTSADSDDPVIDYVTNINDHCAYDDGYVCLENVIEEQFESAESDKKLLPGAYLKAYSVAERDFSKLDHLSEEQRRLKHYKIGFTENATNFIVIFRALVLPNLIDGKPEGYSHGSFGITTKYWIDKQTYAINDRKLYR